MKDGIWYCFLQLRASFGLPFAIPSLYLNAQRRSHYHEEVGYFRFCFFSSGLIDCHFLVFFDEGK